MTISRRFLLLSTLMTASYSRADTSDDNSSQPYTARDENEGGFFKLYPVGRVKRKGEVVSLHIFKKYSDALKGLDGFSHVFILYWFDRNDTPEKRSILQVHPRGNMRNPLTGVFACRAPVRPNLIALSLCRILSVKNNIVFIENIDALNNSPILDIKPYIPQIDHKIKDVRLPDWL
ncbi:MAG: tRNA (N6-threonylcarbamoyladenosine(37)-N6)-methyltransferase TrmO [Sedimentisphaerales bacterium]|nr:tRNA (N6-threonylcarbamoyladenosine(37)-N6)-methyltransferase TrmO [Sedimentisphaerales bacterium]